MDSLSLCSQSVKLVRLYWAQSATAMVYLCAIAAASRTGVDVVLLLTDLPARVGWRC